MIRCAPSRSFDLTSALIWSCCCSVNSDSDATQRRHALDRVLQRLPDPDHLRLQIGSERRRQVERRQCRLVEDVVAFADHVADVRERQQHVLAALDRLVVDAGKSEQPVREPVDVVGCDPGDVAGGPDDRVRLGAHDARLVQFLERAAYHRSQTGAAEEPRRRERHRPAQPTHHPRPGEGAARQLPDRPVLAVERPRRPVGLLLRLPLRRPERERRALRGSRRRPVLVERPVELVLRQTEADRVIRHPARGVVVARLGLRDVPVELACVGLERDPCDAGEVATGHERS
jgi:hypothetical protein